MFPGSLLVQNAKLGKTGAATKPCSRGLYDRGVTSDSSLSRRRGWPGVLFILERRPTPVRGHDRRFWVWSSRRRRSGRRRRDAIASVAAHGPDGGAFAPDAFSRLILGRLPWRPNAICFHAAKGLDIGFFVPGLRSRRWLRGKFGHGLEAKGGRDEWSAEDASGRYRGRPGSKGGGRSAPQCGRVASTEASRFRVTAR